MDGGFTNITRRQIHSGEHVAIIMRFVTLIGLCVAYALTSRPADILHWRNITAGVIVVVQTAYSMLCLQLLAKGRFPLGFSHLSSILDAATVGAFLWLALRPPTGSVHLVFVALTFIAFPLVAGTSLLRFFPVNTLVTALVSSLFALAGVVALGVRAGWDALDRAYFLLPAGCLVLGLLAWLGSFTHYKLLERNLVTEDLQRASRRLRMTMEIVQASIFNLSQFVNNLDKISTGLAEGARNQATSVDRISSSVAALNESQEEIFNSTEISAKTINRTVDSSDNGNLVVKKVITEIRSISDVVDRMVSSLELIDDIADNTNLLALNANIEANRAGEESRGFSVVADEIRKLAEQSQETASEVSRLVKQIAKVIFIAGSSSKNAGEIFDKINSDLTGYAEYVKGLHRSVEDQLRANREVERSVGRISAVTTENTSAADRVRDVVGELQKEVAKLKSLVDGKLTESARMPSSEATGGR